MYEDIVGGVRQVWINRDCGALHQKNQQRKKLLSYLEAAETSLISKAVKARNKSQRIIESTDGEEMMESGSRWKDYLSPEERTSMRLPVFGLLWMPSLPLLGEKVDVIDHCRKEIARFNTEIAEDRISSENLATLNSAFVEFERQIDAYIISQSAVHFSPFQFSPQYVGASSKIIIWQNIRVRWWERYARTLLVVASILILIVGWAVPVAFTGFLSQLTYLTTVLPWLRHYAPWSLGLLQGVLPQAILVVLTIQIPSIIRLLAQQQGFVLETAVELAVQKYYFSFLFLQVFLTVSLSSSVATVAGRVYHSVTSVPTVLATSLPKTSNYFLSYLLLQAFSISASELLQIAGLLQYFVFSALLDTTPRQKYQRRLAISRVRWGSVYPVYTNLACIGIVYSVIAPLILIFVITAFGMFWFAFRYNILYVTVSWIDTGGLLYPTALNQLFTGIYVLELCLIGLFFLARNEDERWACLGQAVIMIITFVLTCSFQVLMNRALAPLLMHPYSILRQDKRFNDASGMNSNALEPFEDSVLHTPRPTVWIPSDPLGISEDEVARTKEMGDEVLISNRGAKLDLKGNLIIDEYPDVQVY